MHSVADTKTPNVGEENYRITMHMLIETLERSIARMESSGPHPQVVLAQPEKR